jgi:aldehyde:ferredoxin oxidoreductase
MDSLILCKFLRGVFADPLAEWAALLNSVTGWDTDAEELATTARRIVMAKRLFNVREGWTRGEDWLPERFLSESLKLDSGRAATLTPDQLTAMIGSYYRGRGLDSAGLPTATELDQLGLETVAVGSGQMAACEGD